MKRSHLSNFEQPLYPPLAAIHSFCLSATVLLDMNARGIADTEFLLLRQDYSESDQTYRSIKRFYSRPLKNFLLLLTYNKN